MADHSELGPLVCIGLQQRQGVLFLSSTDDYQRSGGSQLDQLGILEFFVVHYV